MCVLGVVVVLVLMVMIVKLPNVSFTRSSTGNACESVSLCVGRGDG